MKIIKTRINWGDRMAAMQAQSNSKATTKPYDQSFARSQRSKDNVTRNDANMIETKS